MRRQAELLGLEFVPIYGSKREGNFREKLVERLKALGMEAGVFGDLHQREHRSFLEGVCSELGIEALFPLWGRDEREVIEKVLRISKPIVVCRRIRKVPRRFLGRELSYELINYLAERGMPLSGEGGEYQSFVVRGEEFDMDVTFKRTIRRSLYECLDLEVVG